MYADPRHIRNNRINLSLTDTERRAIEAIAELNGTQPAVLVRDLMIEFLRSSGVDSAHADPQLRATH
jgi:hypothetical protein